MPDGMTVGRASLAGATVVAAVAVAGCGHGATRKAERLPLAGTAPGGQQYRLEAGRRDPDDDSPTSYCLRLRYTGDIVVDGDPFVGGIDACGPAPAPFASGTYAADCKNGTLYVLGGVRGDGSIELVSDAGDTIRPRTAALPPHAGFSGTTFLLVAELRSLPATLRRRDGGHATLARFPERRALCRPMPGAPEGGEPFGDFPEP